MHIRAIVVVVVVVRTEIDSKFYSSSEMLLAKPIHTTFIH
jgi:hypothetical protein